MTNAELLAKKEKALLEVIDKLYKQEGNMGEVMAKTIYTLCHASVLMPVTVEDMGKLQEAAVEGATSGKLIIDNDNIKPIVVANPEGNKYLPCYTSEEQALDRREDMRFIQMNMLQLISIFEQVADLSGIILNPATTKFLIEDIIIKHIKLMAEDESKRKAESEKE
jgi:hypothetical protein